MNIDITIMPAVVAEEFLLSVVKKKGVDSENWMF